MRFRCLLVGLATLAMTMAARADGIFASGGLSGFGDPNTQVMIIDVSPLLSVSLGGDAVGTLSNQVISGETISFDYTMPGTGTFGGSAIHVYRNILNGSGNIIDTFRIDTDGGATAHITYGSDTPINLNGSTHLVDLLPAFPDLVASPTPLTLVSFCPSTGCGTVNGTQDISLEFVADVPEGPNMILLSSAFLAIAFAFRRRWQVQ